MSGNGQPSRSIPRADRRAATHRAATPRAIPELHEVDCPPELREQIEELMSAATRDRRSASIPALWAVQRRYGWCTPEGIRQAAAVMRVTPAYLESVASFYDLLRTAPVGKHQVLVCTNISCWMRGADELLDAFCEAAGSDRRGRATAAPTPRTGASSSPASSASAPATWRRWPRSTSATSARSEPTTRKAVEQLLLGEDVLPDKALERRGAARRPRAASPTSACAGKTGPNA